MKANNNDTLVALGFVAAFSLVMATPAFAEKVIASGTTTHVGTPVTTTNTSTTANVDGSTTTSYHTKTITPAKTVTYTITADDRTKLTNYLGGKSAKKPDGCPEGQYYYDGKCLPEPVEEGLVSKKTYIIGKPLPANIDLLPLDSTFISTLAPLPSDLYYTQLGSDVLLIDRDDNTVVDAVTYYEM